MDATLCSSCHRACVPETLFARAAPGASPQDDPGHPGVQKSPLCEECTRWIGRATQLARLGRPELASILGAPVPTAGRMARAGECTFCRGRLRAPGATIEFLPLISDDGGPGLQLVLCGACEIWLASLVLDNRSARRVTHRDLDGEYGAFLHPNLRGIAVSIDTADEGTEIAIRHACASMGIDTAPGAAAPVLIVEASDDGRATRHLRDAFGPRRATVVAAPANAHHDLADALLEGATEWVTAPLTPQQLAAALARAVRLRPAPQEWDPASCLPIAHLPPRERAALVALPARDVDPFDAAWLLRRFARGYDELLVHDGAILLLPRAPASKLPAIAARLERVLLGRCRFAPFAPPALRHFEATA